ncbi:OmpA family protein [Zooshikella harenae]|uniref:OmpA family protein n=1 Tax=Zooshikella harenae TaxID=2827238 RepID=A0ABS5Z8M3_9GAMM|nr:OmpA family protein [Zooshikella harenae]MBU2710390.1 OmpA family protein [Zooshikella harenae]
MKQQLLASAFCLLINLPVSALHADEPIAEVEDKLLMSSSGMVIGGLAAGPFGVVLGAAAGDFISERLALADQAEQNAQALSKAEQELQSLRTLLNPNETITVPEDAEYLQLPATDKLAVDIHFFTGKNDIPQQEIDKIGYLINTLNANPQLDIQLEGFADIRGKNDSNYQLSLSRVNAIHQMLLESGIDDQRINSIAHGNKLAQNSSISDQQALDRKVRVTFFVSDEWLNQ